MAEQAPFKRLVVGSSPTRLTTPFPGPSEGDGAMDHRDHVGLLRGGVDHAGPDGADWADLGSGTGAFTLALADLLGPGGRIVSVDRDAGALREQGRTMADRFPGTALRQVVADFRTDLSGALGLSALDGIVMANSLHFSSDHVAVIRQVVACLRPGGRLVLVEYDADHGNPWVPHPLSFATWRRVAPAAGLTEPRLLGRVPSRFLGAIYSAVAERPLAAHIDRSAAASRSY
jgi:SAM-dependent methyltransferase